VVFRLSNNHYSMIKLPIILVFSSIIIKFERKQLIRLFAKIKKFTLIWVLPGMLEPEVLKL
jgi:hypothetical protein